MARISRLIIYDSDDDDALAKQIKKSLPEGVYEKEVKIIVIALKDVPYLSDAIEKVFPK